MQLNIRGELGVKTAPDHVALAYHHGVITAITINGRENTDLGTRGDDPRGSYEDANHGSHITNVNGRFKARDLSSVPISLDGHVEGRKRPLIRATVFNML